MKAARVGRMAARFYLALLALFFAVPLLTMARYAFQNIPVVNLTWSNLFQGWSLAALGRALSDPALWQFTRTSALLAICAIGLNLVLLLPPALYAELRSKRLRTMLTNLTLLPWVVPPIAFVVGVAATLRQVLPTWLSSVFSLVPFYAIWAMPFVYRALDAGLRSINARTLVEAGQSLGASMPRITLRVLIPNLSASMIAAAGLTIAMVMGEFAFAALLLKNTLPTYLLIYQRQEPQAGIALALVLMIVIAIVLSLVAALLKRRGIAMQATGI